MQRRCINTLSFKIYQMRCLFIQNKFRTFVLDFLGNFNIECIQMPEIYSESGEIDWEEFKKTILDQKEDLKPFECKKCKETFFCKEYLGKFPLCKKHRYSFKK